jgi:FAD dependent oxidoreductase TIGR03364
LPRVVIAGAGILGTMHAWFARRAGWEVVLIDRHTEGRGATVRNFGLVWVSGRAPGAELAAALRARQLWEEIGAEAAGIGFRPDGSTTLVDDDAALRVLEEVAARPDAAERGFELLDAGEVRRRNPALRGSFVAGLFCAADAVVEPRAALPALRRQLSAGAGFSFLGGDPVEEVGSGFVKAGGRRHSGDVVVVCPGAASDGPLASLLEGAPLRRCRLQMMQTAPLGERLATSLADGDSLRYYPAFDTAARAGLGPREGIAERLRMQLLVSQRRGGELTIGDTHDYDEPFAFDVEEAAYAELARRAEAALGRPLPPVERRWAGVYSQVTDGGLCWRAEVLPRVWVVTGPGGRGMTLSPAIAEDTMRLAGAPDVVAAMAEGAVT